MTIHFATPCYRSDPEIAIQWFVEKAHELKFKDPPTVHIECNCPLIHVARARIAAKFLEGDCDWLFLRDDDIDVSSSTIQSMIDMNVNCTIAPYLVRNTDRFDVVFDESGNVVWAGLGCALIRRSVIEKLWAEHYEELHFYEEHRLRVGIFRDFFAEIDGVRRLLKEDHAFWYRVRAAGYSINVLDSSIVNHAGRSRKFSAHELTVGPSGE